jgi:hypothetical protein
MPASPGPERRLGDRPHGTVTAAAVAEWETRTFGRLAPFQRPAPGAVNLDDVLPDLDDMLADPDAAVTAIADELGL